MKILLWSLQTVKHIFHAQNIATMSMTFTIITLAITLKIPNWYNNVFSDFSHPDRIRS